MGGATRQALQQPGGGAVQARDVSCAQAFEGVVLALRRRGVRVGCCGLSSETRRTMERSGILALIGEENVFWSIDRALTQDCGCTAVIE